MRPQKVDDLEILQALMSVLRSKGYDGASLNELADASGLKKASLYHRYPGGKKEMAGAVLDYVAEWVDKYIYQVLVDPQRNPDDRLNEVLNNIRALYQEGEAICILRALSMDTGMALFGAQIAENMKEWIMGFTQLGLDLGLPKKEAHALAQKTLIDIQGSLVVAKGMEDTGVFQDTLKTIEQRYKS